jgi:hypothetical protein
MPAIPGKMAETWYYVQFGTVASPLAHKGWNNANLRSCVVGNTCVAQDLDQPLRPRICELNT